MRPWQPHGKLPRHSPEKQRADKPIPADIYPVIDNDLARDNLENNLPAADLEDL